MATADRGRGYARTARAARAGKGVAVTDFRFRGLYDDLLDYTGDSAARDVLAPALPGAQAVLADLARYGAPGAHEAPFEDAASWRLYAFSRVVDTMLLGFQPGEHDSWRGPGVTLEEYAAFMRALGLRTIERNTYHPFHHEIVAVEQDDDPAAPPRLVEVLWPGFMLGGLLIARAGVRIRSGARAVVASIATRSTLYWTYRRRNRPTCDLSHGWGHNSQWTTDFRCDYEDDSAFYYNVDGDFDVATQPLPVDDDEPSLSREQRIELVVHRGLVRTALDEDRGLWPFDDHYVEAKAR